MIATGVERLLSIIYHILQNLLITSNEAMENSSANQHQEDALTRTEDVHELPPILTEEQQLPPPEGTQETSPPTEEQEESLPPSSPKMQIYEVVVPQGVQPNGHFTVLASNYRVLLTCPPNIVPGQKVRFKIPALPDIPISNKSINITIKLSYARKEGLRRTTIF